tara:strand:- start:202 stop:630 length:429 start_codon:yes stop_codon:yes gene_type:complete
MKAFTINNVKKYHLKIIGLFVLIFIFSILYSFLDSTHFQGINPLQDKIKDKIVKRETDDVIKESFQYVDQDKRKVTENIEKVVKDEEDKIERPSSIQNFFDRLYFSIITACLLGYGDIYPATNTTKTLSAIQSLLTVCLILY